MIQPRPLRSSRFVPGNRQRWLDRTAGIPADAVIYDLEDSVPAAERPQAREMVRAAIGQHGAAKALFVHVNGVDTGQTFDDLEAVVHARLYGVVLPKVRGPEDVTVVDGALSWFERRAGLPVGGTIVNPLPETAEAMRSTYDVAKASPRVAHLGAGTAAGGDVARAIGDEWTPQGLESLSVRSKVIFDVRSAGVQYPMSGVWTDIQDLAGLRAFCVQSRQLGYTGLMSIHPGHLPVINEVFSPTPEEVVYWEELIRLLEEAERNGTTAITFRGEMVDTAMVKTGRDRLALARTLGEGLE